MTADELHMAALATYRRKLRREIEVTEKVLEALPENHVIERQGLKYRLDQARKQLERITGPESDEADRVQLPPPRDKDWMS